MWERRLVCGSCWSTRDPACRTGTCAHAEGDHGLWKCPQHLLLFLGWLPSPCLHQGLLQDHRANLDLGRC